MAILLVVGNGLSIDFTEQVIPIHRRLNTRIPLTWTVPIRSEAGASAFEVLAELGAAIKYTTAVHPQLTDFEKIEALANISAYTPQFAPLCSAIEATHGRWIRGRPLANLCSGQQLDLIGLILRYQVRLFLNAAFTHYHAICGSHDWRRWPWYKWFRRYFDELGMLCSFNYDLTAETVLASAASNNRQAAYLVGQGFPNNALPVFKPHGSINFTTHPQAIYVGGISVYQGGNIFERNDTPVAIKAPNALHDPLLVSDIVLPLEYSPIAGFQYIRVGYQHLQDHGGGFQHCVIAGLSYWECDRPEINAILDALGPDTAITLCNPTPNQAMTDFLGARFGQVRFNGVHPPFDI